MASTPPAQPQQTGGQQPSWWQTTAGTAAATGVVTIALGMLGMWKDVSVMKESFREDRIARNRMEIDHKTLADKVANLDSTVKAIRMIVRIPPQ